MVDQRERRRRRALTDRSAEGARPRRPAGGGHLARGQQVRRQREEQARHRDGHHPTPTRAEKRPDLVGVEEGDDGREERGLEDGDQQRVQAVVPRLRVPAEAGCQERVDPGRRPGAEAKEREHHRTPAEGRGREARSEEGVTQQAPHDDLLER
jgi:hypothetical protein